jgi:DNA-binding XRE family transcriptional regulator
MGKADKEGLARRVRERRVKLRLSQNMLAKAAGMSQQGILNIEKGIVARPRQLPELALALETSTEWLLHARGPEVVRVINAREELLALAEQVDAERIGAAIQLLKKLLDEAGSKVA